MNSLSQKVTAFERLLTGDVASLARAISLLEAGGEQSMKDLPPRNLPDFEPAS